MPVGYPMLRLVEGSIRGVIVFLILVSGFDRGNEFVDGVREVFGAWFFRMFFAFWICPLGADYNAKSELGFRRSFVLFCVWCPGLGLIVVRETSCCVFVSEAAFILPQVFLTSGDIFHRGFRTVDGFETVALVVCMSGLVEDYRSFTD